MDARVQKARTLRSNLTVAEQQLWCRLRYRQIDGHKFRRQRPIGPYIVDFVCLEVKLIVEVDGGQHSDTKIYDEARDHWLKSQGNRVLRFWNNDVLMNMEGVLQIIQSVASELPPVSSPVSREEISEPVTTRIKCAKTKFRRKRSGNKR